MTYFEDLLDAIHFTMSLLTLRKEKGFKPFNLGPFSFKNDA